MLRLLADIALAATMGIAAIAGMLFVLFGVPMLLASGLNLLP